MGVIDHAKLLEPYSEATPPANTAAKRTPEGQRAWLLKRGIPEGIANDAMTAVYTELAGGRVFRGTDDFPAGYWLDRYLLETARELLRKSGPPKLGMSYEDMVSIAAFSREALKAAYWKGMATGAGIAAAISIVSGYFLCP